MLELIIKNGTLYDGTGREGIKGNLGVLDGKIVLLGDGELPEAGEVFDASGLAVSPGFIDAHTHSDCQVLPGLDSERGSKLLQGNTTEIAGQRGSSRAPYLPDAPMDEETRERMFGKVLFPLPGTFIISQSLSSPRPPSDTVPVPIPPRGRAIFPRWEPSYFLRTGHSDGSQLPAPATRLSASAIRVVAIFFVMDILSMFFQGTDVGAFACRGVTLALDVEI